MFQRFERTAGRAMSLGFRILSEFTRDSFSDTELRSAVEAAYAGFDLSAIAPLTEIGRETCQIQSPRD